MLNRHKIGLGLTAWLILCFAISAAAQGGSLGQSSTLLPNGDTLLLGGFNTLKEPVSDAFIISSLDNSARKLNRGMRTPRAGQTATTLPDGTVLIFGGVGPNGKLVADAELFDPQTLQFSLLPEVLAVPRAFHTATLLTDGTVLFAGGTTAGGQLPDDVQLWDYRSRNALSFHALLMTPRQGHTARLLPDGEVRVSRGADHFGRPVSVDEIYDPISKRFRFAGTPETAETIEPFGIAESIPLDGAEGVPLQDPVALRLTQLVNIATVNSSNFALTGPNESVVGARVTTAEGGRLVFILPQAPLQPGTTYVLRIKNVTDVTGKGLPQTSITFQTLGQPPDAAGPDWIPNSTWTDNSGITKFQTLPPLQAAPGSTALAGQVLRLNGWPLQNVTLEIDGKKTRTDSTGRFLLQGLAPGHHVLWIDGSTANHAGADYGIHEVGATILPNKTNVLNYTIWMTRLDLAHAVTIASPTSAETVITNPYLPGLELRLPAGTVITDRNGKTVRQISITPVPLNKPPFPLPAGVEVPLYFTIQPGGAYISIRNPSASTTGARLIYPNAGNLPPGAPFEFWNYDADAKGWYVYGLGKVSPDARSVIPDPSVVIYEFTGAMVGPPTTASAFGTPAGSSADSNGGDPVQLSTGQFIYTKTDLALPDTVPISLSRTYIANDSRARAFGIGTTFQYDIFMVGNISPYDYQELILPDGGRVRFDRISPGTSWNNALYVHASSGSPFYGALLSPNTDPSMPWFWKLVLKDGTIYGFPESSASTSHFCQAVIGIQDRYGNRIKIDRSASPNCRATKITSPNGRSISLTYDSQGRVSQASDSAGRNVLYSYDTTGRLSTVTDTNGGITTYTYDDQNRMLTIKDARNLVYLTNQYDSAGRVVRQTQADGSVYQFAWTAAAVAQTHFFTFTGSSGGGTGGSVLTRNGCWGANGFNRYDPNCGEAYMALVAQVDVTDPRGYVRRVAFGSAGYMTSDTHALGQPEQQTVTYEYYADNTLKSVTDALGRKTSFDYDANGNRTRVTRLDGTSDAVTTTFAHEPQFNQLTSITDPLNHTTSFSYDQKGNLITTTDALNHQTSLAYNTAGQLSSVTDALNNVVQFGYFGGDLVSVTDPLGNVSSSFYDAAGRIVSATDPQGNTVKMQYSPLNLVTQVTDPKGNNTVFSYDPNGNLLSLTDAANHTTSYAYDNMDRALTRTDPLLRQESYSYDLNGNLVSSTDRKSQVTSLTYDPLNRPKLVGYNTVVNAGVTAYESTVGYTYDAGNRMTQAVDSAGGTITQAYDNLGRLSSETTPQGQISYGYDLAGHRASMTVAGQPQITYSYDSANRLTQIAQGTSTLGFSYDNINRRATLTLSNGVNVSYSYDNDSRVTGITYKFNANTLGNLTYTYDSLGRRTQVGGSFAQTGLPTAVTLATYDAANELTNWNGTAISYDLNGNMLSDGTNSFSWNARNQVAGLNGRNLQYDAAGRRVQNLLGLSFLYDGANAAQELSGSTVTANLLSGGVDEVFTRTDSSGSFTPLKDALGSTIGLVDVSGNLVTSYTYDPFGNTTVSGFTNTNEFQYTGRENEGNGLYFYRNRFYSPLLSRFISEDPLGFTGSGPNFYSYVFDSPTNLVDPYGLSAAPALVPLVGAGGGLTVITGGGGAGAAITGTVVETGSIGGPVGVAVLGAGTAGWFAGRGIGHIPIGHGQTIDDGVQLIGSLTLFRPDPNPNPGAGPLFNPHPQPLPGVTPLAGRKPRNQGEEVSCTLVDEWEIIDPGTRQSHKVCEYQCDDGTPEVREGFWGADCAPTITKTSQ